MIYFIIKLFDRIHNMQTIRVKFSEKIKKISSESLLCFIGLGTYLQDNLTKVEGSSTKLFRLETRINNLCYTSIKPKPKQVIIIIRKLPDGYKYHLLNIY